MGLFRGSGPREPENNHGNSSPAPTAASRRAQLKADRELLKLAEEAEAEGDVEHAQEIRRTIGD